MNNKKLVSKNSVQKFKQGRKIVKAEVGLKSKIIKKGQNAIRGVINTITNPGFWFNTNGSYNWQYRNINPLIYTQNKIDQGLNSLNHLVQSKITNPENYPTVQQQKASPTTSTNKDGISFKNAFNQARNSGLKEFTWNGKRFNTKNKGEENYIFSNGKWINPNIKFTVPSITEPTQEEMKELDRKAKPIINFTVPAPTDMTSEEIDKLNSKAKPIWEGATFAKKGGNLVPNFR